MKTAKTATRPRAKHRVSEIWLNPEHLQATIDLVTAMYETLARGDALIPEQVIACHHNPILGTLWYRIHDYCEYQGRAKRLHRIAFDDRISIALEQQFAAEARAWRLKQAAHRAALEAA